MKNKLIPYFSVKYLIYIIEYRIDGLTTVSPKLEYNKPIQMPIPLLPEEEQNKNMLLNN